MLKHLVLLSLLSLISVGAGCGNQAQTSSETFGAEGVLLVETSVDSKKSMHVEVNKDDLAGHANITQYIGKSLASLPAKGEAQVFLSDFATKNAYKNPSKDGVNCWFTSIASVMPTFETARYMTGKEFACHLKTSFTMTTTPKFGDVIRFHKADGEEVHGATYVGQDASGKVIAFTKNGTTKDTPWSFMTLETLQKRVYSETEAVTYYTPTKEAKDPSEGMPCFEEAKQSRMETKQMHGGGGPLGDFFDM